MSKLIALALLFTPLFASASPSCPAVAPNPKEVVCAPQLNVGGVKFSKKLIVPLTATENYKEWSGTLTFDIPGVSIPGETNTLKVTLMEETHGNNETCPVRQIIDGEINVLGTKSSISRITRVKLDESVGLNIIDLNMTCLVR